MLWTRSNGEQLVHDQLAAGGFSVFLSRDFQTTKERYEGRRRRYEEAQVAASLERGQQIEQFRILDPAIPPREPDAPNRIRLLMLAFVLATGLPSAPCSPHTASPSPTWIAIGLRRSSPSRVE